MWVNSPCTRELNTYGLRLNSLRERLISAPSSRGIHHTGRRLNSPLTVLEAQLWVPAGSALTVLRLNHYCQKVQLRPSGGSTPTVWRFNSDRLEINSDRLEAQLRPSGGSTPTSGGSTPTVWRVNFHCLDAQIWLSGCSTLTVWRLNSGCLEAQLWQSGGSTLGRPEAQLRRRGGSTPTVIWLNSNCLDAQLWPSGGLTLTVYRGWTLIIRRLNCDCLGRSLLFSLCPRFQHSSTFRGRIIIILQFTAKDHVSYITKDGLSCCLHVNL